MYNDRNNSTNRGSSRSNSRPSSNRGSSFNRSNDRESFNKSSDKRKSDFLSTPVKREFSSERRFEDRREPSRGSNFNRREDSRPSFERRESKPFSDRRESNRPSFSEARGSRGERSEGERSSGYPKREGSSFHRESSNRSSESSFGNRRSFGGNRNGGSRFGNRGGGRRGGRGVAKQLDESLFIQEARPIEAQEPYKPQFRFDELPISNVLIENIKRKGFLDPMPIQDQSIPHILDGKDIVGIANTGTGKTGAFLIPLIEKVVKGRHNKVLILAPTRELAEQIEEELFTLTKELRIYGVKCIGGDNIQKQIYQLRRGYNFVIGTPGRVEDLIERRMIDLSTFHTIVLDEVDRMLDMGFVDEIKEIISMLPAEKQSLFFSATVDNKVEALMKTILKPDYVKVSVKTGVTSHNIHQNVVYFSDSEEKMEKLKKTLNEYADKKVLIFVNTKREVDKLDDLLYKENYEVTAIHGDKRQNWRKKSIERFKSGKSNILVATDVAARGLDISGVALVLNFDIPNNHEDYIHRIGRTGRANQMGNALTFIQRKNNRAY